MKRPASPCGPEETLEEQLTALKTARQDIEMLKDELVRVKKTMQDMQEIGASVQELEEKIRQAASNVELLWPVMTDQTKEITLLKHETRSLSTQVEDFQDRMSLEYQHTRAHEMAIQKLADASTAHPRDVMSKTRLKCLTTSVIFIIDTGAIVVFLLKTLNQIQTWDPE